MRDEQRSMKMREEQQRKKIRDEQRSMRDVRRKYERGVRITPK